MTTEEKAQRYDEMSKEVKDFFDGKLMMYSDVKQTLNYLFPELAESEDERIRKELIDYINRLTVTPNNIDIYNSWIAWLEKQGNNSNQNWKPTKEQINALEHFVRSIAESGYASPYDDNTKLLKSLINDLYKLEKQGEPIDENRLAKGVLIEVADSIIRWLDANCADGNMCLSNMECEDIENAVRDADWQKVYGYMKKKLERQCEQKPLPKDYEDAFDEFISHIPEKDPDSPNSLYTYEDLESAIQFGIEWQKGQKVAMTTMDKTEPKFKVGDWIVDNCNNVWQVVEVSNNFYRLKNIDEFESLPKIKWVDETFHLWSVKNAKDGDVLFHSDSASNGIFIFKEIRYDGKVLCYCDYDSEDGFCLGEKHTCCWADAKILHPTTKEQRDLLFQKMKEEGYEWYAEKKELKKLTQSVTKTSEQEEPQVYETGDGDIITYSETAGYKVEPKLKIESGKWYVCIKNLLDDYGNSAFCKGDVYLSEKDEYLIPCNSNVPWMIAYCVDTYFKEWTIKDAKDGDVLVASDGSVFIYAGSTDRHAKCYVALTKYGTFNLKGGNWEDKYSVHPATKEQRDLLFQKMKEEGYEWDADKKELKIIDFSKHLKYDHDAPSIIEQKHTWSDEDEENLQNCCGAIGAADYYTYDDKQEMEKWLKSLKERLS